MKSEYERPYRALEHDRVSRRRLLLALPALIAAPRLLAQTPAPPIRVRGLNHVTLSVSDVKRDRKSTRLNSSHIQKSRMPSSA